MELKHSTPSVLLHLGFSAQGSWKNPLLGCDELPLDLSSQRASLYFMLFILLSIAHPFRCLQLAGRSAICRECCNGWHRATGAGDCQATWCLSTATSSQPDWDGTWVWSSWNLFCVLQILKESPQIWRCWDASGCTKVRLKHGRRFWHSWTKAQGCHWCWAREPEACRIHAAATWVL